MLRFREAPFPLVLFEAVSVDLIFRTEKAILVELSPFPRKYLSLLGRQREKWLANVFITDSPHVEFRSGRGGNVPEKES